MFPECGTDRVTNHNLPFCYRLLQSAAERTPDCDVSDRFSKGAIYLLMGSTEIEEIDALFDRLCNDGLDLLFTASLNAAQSQSQDAETLIRGPVRQFSLLHVHPSCSSSAAAQSFSQSMIGRCCGQARSH